MDFSLPFLTGSSFLFLKLLGETEFGPSSRVDIYDVSTGTWTISALSVAREGLVGAALGNLIIFGGGITNGTPVPVIDIYNTSTGQWSNIIMSSASDWRLSAVQGTKMFFCGNGKNSGLSMVDVYDICLNSWSHLNLSDGRREFGSRAAGGKVLFGGGSFINNVVKTVDIFILGALIGPQ